MPVLVSSCSTKSWLILTLAALDDDGGCGEGLGRDRDGRGIRDPSLCGVRLMVEVPAMRDSRVEETSDAAARGVTGMLR